MYFDNKPCQVCGAEVRLRSHRRSTRRGEPNPDGTVDERVCTNADCMSNTEDQSDAPAP